MTEAQIQLQNALTTTFLANLAFLSEYDNELYHRVDELSRMIENGTYKEKYALEFIMESGDFDIYDLVNNKYLYNKNPKKINDELLRKCNLDIKNSIFNLSEYFLRKDIPRFNEKERFISQSRIKTYHQTQNDILQYSSILKDYLDNRKKRFKKIKKFIFIGTLLGRHIPRIAQKINSNIYLVLERNLEIFRLSLFTVDYTILSREGVIFSIMDDSIDEEKKIKKFIDYNYLDNYILKFSTTTINIDDYVDKLLSYLVSQKPTIYDYNRTLYISLYRRSKILNSKKVLLFNQIKNNCDLFNNKPILYLAAGPSLNDNLEWIKKNQNNFFIVTIGASYKKLLLNEIRVDMIVTLDEEEILSELQFSYESINLIDKKTIILANCSTHEKIIEKLKDYNLFLFETQLSFHKNNIAFSGFSVGELTIDILLKMNAKEIYLLGLDLSLNQNTGLSHSENSNSGIKIYDLNEQNNRDFFSLNKGIINVKGNFREQVSTTSLFYMSIKYLEKILTSKEQDVNIYNLSNHGAYFEGTIPLEIENINMNKDIKNINLFEFLERNSVNTLSKESKESIKKEIKVIEEFKEKEFLLFKKLEIEDYEKFSEKALELLKILKGTKYNYLMIIFDNYSKNIFPYISYHFNDLKIKNEVKKINNTKKVFELQVENIINDYLYCLKKIIE